MVIAGTAGSVWWRVMRLLIWMLMIFLPTGRILAENTDSAPDKLDPQLLEIVQKLRSEARFVGALNAEIAKLRGPGERYPFLALAQIANREEKARVATQIFRALRSKVDAQKLEEEEILSTLRELLTLHDSKVGDELEALFRSFVGKNVAQKQWNLILKALSKERAPRKSIELFFQTLIVSEHPAPYPILIRFLTSHESSSEVKNLILKGIFLRLRIYGRKHEADLVFMLEALNQLSLSSFDRSTRQEWESLISSSRYRNVDRFESGVFKHLFKALEDEPNQDRVLDVLRERMSSLKYVNEAWHERYSEELQKFLWEMPEISVDRLNKLEDAVMSTPNTDLLFALVGLRNGGDYRRGSTEEQLKSILLKVKRLGRLKKTVKKATNLGPLFRKLSQYEQDIYPVPEPESDPESDESSETKKTNETKEKSQTLSKSVQEARKTWWALHKSLVNPDFLPSGLPNRELLTLHLYDPHLSKLRTTWFKYHSKKVYLAPTILSGLPSDSCQVNLPLEETPTIGPNAKKPVVVSYKIESINRKLSAHLQRLDCVPESGFRICFSLYRDNNGTDKRIGKGICKALHDVRSPTKYVFGNKELDIYVKAFVSTSFPTEFSIRTPLRIRTH